MARLMRTIPIGCDNTLMTNSAVQLHYAINSQFVIGKWTPHKQCAECD